MSKKKNNNPNKNEKYMTILIYAAVIILVAAAGSLYFIMHNKEKEENIPYTEFIKDIDEGKVEKIEMTVGSTTLKVTYKDREKEDDTEKVIIPNVQAFVEYIHHKAEERKLYSIS